jgi:hypothetical protein
VSNRSGKQDAQDGKKMTQTIDPTLTRLTVFALSDTEWRISDATRPESDGLALLAFIQRIGSLYEVTELAKPSRRTYFRSLSAAVGMLSSTIGES